jgi:restriction endonuclease Mrr
MGYTAYQTPRSHDHGVDVFVESHDTLAGGRIVISAKRYNHTVGPDHVRALNTVVGDQGAIKGILVTTSTFGPESYRIARDKPLDLVDGENSADGSRNTSASTATATPLPDHHWTTSTSIEDAGHRTPHRPNAA